MASYKVTLVNDDGLNQTIAVAHDQTIFDAAEEADIDLPAFCRSGSCSSCVGKILTGYVDQSEQACLNDELIKIGFVVTCVALPLSDCIIKTHQEDALD
jgi:ferredoxin